MGMKLKVGNAYTHMNAFSEQFIIIPIAMLPHDKIRCIVYAQENLRWDIRNTKIFKASRTKLKGHTLIYSMKKIFDTNWDELNEN